MDKKILSVLISSSLIILFVFGFSILKGRDMPETQKKRVCFLEGGETSYISHQSLLNKTQGVIYFTDSKWRHRDVEIESMRLDKYEKPLPCVEIPKSKETTLNLLWEVPGFGKTVLRLNITVFEDNSTVSINKNLAEQKHETFKRESSLYNDKNNLSNTEILLNSSKRYLEEKEYLKSLNYSLRGLERVTIERAESSIEDERKKELEIEFVDQNGDRLKNLNVSYELVDPDFSFGWLEKPVNEGLKYKMENIGFNTANSFSFWHQTEPEDNKWNFTEIKDKIGDLDGSKFGIYGLIGDSPAYTSELTESELEKEVKAHVAKSVQEIESKRDVDYWECYGLGMNYLADQSLQMTSKRSKKSNVQSTKSCIDEVNKMTNDTVIVTGWNIGGSEIRNSSYDEVPYEYYSSMKDREYSIGFDFMYFGGAHELYPELIEKGVYNKNLVTEKNWIPARHLYSLSNMLDWYSNLKRPVYVQHFQAPSNSLENQQGYWHKPWNNDIQAEWISKYYKVVYSKPYVKGINYLEVKDSDWKDLKTGILYSNGTRKKSYKALKDLLNSWHVSGFENTDKFGSLDFRGPRGLYRIQIDELDFNKTLKLGESDRKTIEVNNAS